MPNPGWLVFVPLCVLLVGVPAGRAPAADPEQRAPLNNIQAVDYALLPAGGFLIKVVFTQELKSPPPVLVTHHPVYRMAFDFPDTVSAAGKQPVEVGQRGLRSFQLAQAGNRTRLVLNLDRPFIFETTLKGKELLITLRRRDSVDARDVTRWFSEAALDAPRHGLREVAFQRGESGEGRILVELSDPATQVEIRQQGKTLIVDFFDTALPPRMEQRLDVQDFGTPIRAVETYRLGNGARMKIELEGAGEYSAFQVSRQLVVSLR